LKDLGTQPTGGKKSELLKLENNNKKIEVSKKYIE
jgi:hypothetical protein